MSTKAEMKWWAIVLSFALPGLLMSCCAVKAAQPAAAALAVASPGKAAIEKAAKQNKYLFIFFFQDPQDVQTPPCTSSFRRRWRR